MIKQVPLTVCMLSLLIVLVWLCYRQQGKPNCAADAATEEAEPCDAAALACKFIQEPQPGLAQGQWRRHITAAPAAASLRQCHKQRGWC